MLAQRDIQTHSVFERICLAAAERCHHNPLYSGDVTPKEAWELLEAMPDAVLVDVRTRPEWQHAGMPNLSSTDARLLTLSWKIYPGYAVNTKFLEQLAASGVSMDGPLLFLCHLGGRSLDAAVAAHAAGYQFAFNVIGGFEHEVGEARPQSIHPGWKAEGLPWCRNKVV